MWQCDWGNITFKNFNFSIINMLTEFVNLIDEIGNLGGAVSANVFMHFQILLCVDVSC